MLRVALVSSFAAVSFAASDPDPYGIGKSFKIKKREAGGLFAHRWNGRYYETFGHSFIGTAIKKPVGEKKGFWARRLRNAGTYKEEVRVFGFKPAKVLMYSETKKDFVPCKGFSKTKTDFISIHDIRAANDYKTGVEFPYEGRTFKLMEDRTLYYWKPESLTEEEREEKFDCPGAHGYKFADEDNIMEKFKTREEDEFPCIEFTVIKKGHPEILQIAFGNKVQRVVFWIGFYQRINRDMLTRENVWRRFYDDDEYAEMAGEMDMSAQALPALMSRMSQVPTHQLYLEHGDVMEPAVPKHDVSAVPNQLYLGNGGAGEEEKVWEPAVPKPDEPAVPDKPQPAVEPEPAVDEPLLDNTQKMTPEFQIDVKQMVNAWEARIQAYKNKAQEEAPKKDAKKRRRRRVRRRRLLESLYR